MAIALLQTPAPTLRGNVRFYMSGVEMLAGLNECPMNEQQVAPRLLVPTTLRTGHVNQRARCPQVLNSHLPRPGLRAPTESQDLQTATRLSAACSLLVSCKVMLIPANKAMHITVFKTRKVVNYLIQPPRYLRPLMFTLIFLY